MPKWCAICQHPEHVGRCDHPIYEDTTLGGGFVLRTEIVSMCSCGLVDSLIKEFDLDVGDAPYITSDDGVDGA